MKKMIVLFAMAVLLLTSCSENFSNGERVGYVTQFSRAGIIWKSCEGHLNTTQTGMNSSTGWDFSIDNDEAPEEVIGRIRTAVDSGYMVKLYYHKVWGFSNFLGNRGHTDFFVTSCEIKK